jgi:HK97 family phage major capsid protein
MDITVYNEKRAELIAQAELFVTEMKISDAENVIAEIEQLDAEFGASVENAKQLELLSANINSLKDNAIGIELENVSVKVDGRKVDETVKNTIIDKKTTYENAWAKSMMSQTMSDEEKVIFDEKNAAFSNAYTHTTGNTAVLIPETVVAGIWSRIGEQYPLLGDVKKFNVTGTLTVKKHTAIAVGDAAFYGEGTATADEQNTFGEISLSGCELAKTVTISWKLKSMAVEDFIPYITQELADRIGAALGKSVSTGLGSTATPRQPEGIETALLGESQTPQVVSYDPEATTPDPLAYSDFTDAISRIHSSYLAGASIYANNKTIWTQIANLVDGQGRPLFIPDVTSGGVGRMFGMVVKTDAGITDGSILIGNANAGYIMNTNEPMSVLTEEHIKARETDYSAYTVVDGAVLDTKAFALIRNTPAV